MESLKDKLDNYKGLCLTNEELVNQRINIKKDVREAVLEFEKDLNSFGGLTPEFEQILKHLKIRYEEIFGDFEKLN